MINKIKEMFSENDDLVIRKVKINPFHSIYVIFFDTLVNQDKINEYILKRITSINKLHNFESEVPGSNVNKIKFNKIEYFLYNGFTIVINQNKIYAIETRASLDRSISVNEIEPSLKGPRNAFIENYQTNLGLIKRRIKTSNLKCKNLDIGRISKTKIGILYIEGITKTKLVYMAYQKLEKVDIDLINDSENLKKYLSENPHLPTIIATERPDRCARALSEGKIVILANDSPTALILPAFFIDFINPFSDDYTKDFNINITKFLRLASYILSVVTPAFYIAIVGYNQEAIPSSLMINFSIQRNGIPFPAIIECFLMLGICEILRESDLRFPTKYGSAISILGALVLGESAVSAGLITPIMIIVTAFTYISSLIFPEIEVTNSLRYYRFICLICASFLGLYGLLIGFLVFLTDLISTKSIGYPYMFPLLPFDKAYTKETLFKMHNNKRSQLLSSNFTKEKSWKKSY